MAGDIIVTLAVILFGIVAAAIACLLFSDSADAIDNSFRMVFSFMWAAAGLALIWGGYVTGGLILFVLGLYLANNNAEKLGLVSWRQRLSNSTSGPSNVNRGGDQ